MAGVEQTYEDELRGKPGYIKYAVDARNRVLGVVEQVEPVPGNDVQLTIDLKLQLYTEQILQAGIQSARTHEVTVTGTDLKPVSTGQTFSAPAGAAVIQDPNTGEVLAMASYPTFDNRWFVNSISDEKMQQLFPAERSPLVNRAISGPVRHRLDDEAVHLDRRAAVGSAERRQLRLRRQGHLRDPRLHRLARRLRLQELGRR